MKDMQVRNLLIKMRILSNHRILTIDEKSSRKTMYVTIIFIFQTIYGTYNLLRGWVVDM